MSRFSIILATIALTSCALSPSTVNQIPPEEVHMPVWEDHWSAMHFVDDESTEGAEPKQLRSVLQKSIESHGYVEEFWRPENAVNTIRKLPDGSILVVGEIPDYLAPNWVLHFSSTGSLIREYRAGNEFLGYADGFAYTKNSFGDGGGYNEGVTAIDLKNGKTTVIYDYNHFLATTAHIDPRFTPKNCDVLSVDDADLLSVVKEIAKRTNLKLSELLIGIPCTKNGQHVVPFAAPSSFRYGVAVRMKKGEFYMDVRTWTGALVFPPLYYDNDKLISLVHSFASSESGAYSYSQYHYFIDETYIDTEPRIEEKDYVEFCRLHQCPKGVGEVAGKRQ